MEGLSVDLAIWLHSPCPSSHMSICTRLAVNFGVGAETSDAESSYDDVGTMNVVVIREVFEFCTKKERFLYV